MTSRESLLPRSKLWGSNPQTSVGESAAIRISSCCRNVSVPPDVTPVNVTSAPSSDVRHTPDAQRCPVCAWLRQIYQELPDDISPLFLLLVGIQLRLEKSPLCHWLPRRQALDPGGSRAASVAAAQTEASWSNVLNESRYSRESPPCIRHKIIFCTVKPGQLISK